MSRPVRDALRDRREDVIRAWEALVRADVHYSPVSELVLRDDVPRLLDALADWISTPTPLKNEAVRREALRHALERRAQGHDLAAVLREYRLLRTVILRELLGEREDDGGAPGTRELVVLLNEGLDLAVGECTSGTVEAQRHERARAERAVLASEAKYRSLADAMPQIVCVLAADGTPEYVNASWTAFSGLDLDATRRVGWIGFVHAADVAAAAECRRRVLKLLAPQDVELRYRAADGTYRWYLSRLVPVVEDARVARIVGAGMDIEDRRRREEALRHQLALQDQLAKIAASVPGVVCSFRLHPDGAVSMPFTAPAADDLYGIPRSVLARDMAPVFARIPAEDAERVKAAVAESARTMAPWRAEFRYEHPVTGVRWLEGASIPVAEEDGGVLWHGYVADVTDRKRAEEALREANERLREGDRRKDEFLGMLSHELRNPLAPIRNALYVLDHSDPTGPQARRAREVASRQVGHLTRLVDDLLDVTRIARGKIELRRSDVDLVALAQRSVEDHRALMEERGLDLALDLPPSAVVVHGDETRLAQVLGNLLGNAAKFTPRGGRVTVAVSSEAEQAVVHVRDTGTGIEPGMLQSIFDPFTQAHQGLARTEGGLGLGLALVKGLVALHGGEVAAQSGGPGAGTDVVVRLPLGRPPP